MSDFKQKIVERLCELFEDIECPDIFKDKHISDSHLFCFLEWSFENSEGTHHLMERFSKSAIICTPRDCYIIIRKLLDCGAEIHKNIFFCDLMTPDLCSLLCERGGGVFINTVNSLGDTPIMKAKSVEVVRAFVEHGAAINYCNHAGVTVQEYFNSLVDRSLEIPPEDEEEDEEDLRDEEDEDDQEETIPTIPFEQAFSISGYLLTVNSQ